MSKELSLKSINILPALKKFYSKYGRHAAFAGIIVILLIYVMVVFKIKVLSGAEPTVEQETVVTGSIPKIDGKAIQQIQSLEASNTQVKSLLDQARNRNNPFQE
jgi:predicted PurR-regulated permease PerM